MRWFFWEKSKKWSQTVSDRKKYDLGAWFDYESRLCQLDHLESVFHKYNKLSLHLYGFGENISEGLL